MELAELDLAIRTCVRCPLSGLRSEGEVAVPGLAGSEYRAGGLAILAEAPGAQEAATGRPMQGRTGKLLDKLIEPAGFHRKYVVLLNRVRCRPPNNSLAKFPEALEACDDWTKEELDAYAPSVVAVMGRTALRAVFGTEALVKDVRGQLRETGEKFEYGARLWVPTYHPAATLGGRNPALRPMIVEDLKLAWEESCRTTGSR